MLDDLGVIQQNEYVAKGIKAIPKILITPYLQGFRKSHDRNDENDLYRPISIAMFAAEHDLLGGSATGSHLVNVLIFVGCVVLLFIFLDKLFGGKRTGVAFVAALLYAVHPIHTEVVANIKSRDELLCFFFAFSSLIIFINYARGGKTYRLLVAAGCYFLSLLSKETSASFLLVIPMIFFFYINESKKRSIYLTASAIAVFVVYFCIRSWVLNTNHAGYTGQMYFIDNALAGAPSAASKTATAIFILGKYIKLLFVPNPLIIEYGVNSIPFVGFDNVWVIIALLIYLGIFFIGVWRLIKYPKDPYAFGLLFFVITIAIFSNLFFLIGSTLGERFLFFCSAGFCLIISLLLWKYVVKPGTPANTMPAMLLLIVVPVIILFSVLTINRNAEWRDNYTLFSTDVQKNPNCSRLWQSLGYELITDILPDETDSVKKVQILKDAASYYRNAIAIYPGNSKAHYDLGNIFFKLRQLDSAEVHFKTTLALDPKNPVAMSDLGYVYFMKQEYPKTIALIDSAFALNPHDAGLLNNLAICYLQMNEYDSVIAISKRALVIDSANALAKSNLTMGYKKLAMQDSARNISR